MFRILCYFLIIFFRNVLYLRSINNFLYNIILTIIYITISNNIRFNTFYRLESHLTFEINDMVSKYILFNYYVIFEKQFS